MPGLVTLANLRSRVRQAADMENTNFVSDTEVNQYIQDSAGALIDMVLENADVEWFIRSVSTSTTPGTSIYKIGGSLIDGTNPDAAMPSVYRILGVDLFWDGKLQPIRRYAFRNRNQYIQITGWLRPQTVAYNLAGRDHNGDLQIQFIPTPQGIHQFTVYYIPIPYAISDTDPVLFQGLTGWDEWIVVDAAMKCLEKEESDVSALAARKGELRDRIRSAARAIDSAEPAVANDVYKDPVTFLPWP